MMINNNNKTNTFCSLLLFSLTLLFFLFSDTLAQQQQQQQNELIIGKIRFAPLELETPHALKSVLLPLKPQYFYVNVSGVNYNALSISLMCNQDSSVGCVTTTQINITTIPDQMEKFESIWSRQENVSYPGALIAPTSEPPFKPGVYFISVMTLTQNISNAAILAQAYSGDNQFLFNHANKDAKNAKNGKSENSVVMRKNVLCTQSHRYVVASGAKSFALPVPIESDDKSIELLPLFLFLDAPPTTVGNGDNDNGASDHKGVMMFDGSHVISLNAYMKFGHYADKMRSMKPIIAPHAEFVHENDGDDGRVDDGTKREKRFYFVTSQFFASSSTMKTRARSVLLLVKKQKENGAVHYEPYVVSIRPKRSFADYLIGGVKSLLSVIRL